ncbi:unnamed protein product, partial [Prorocentrum cordatum]
MVGRVRASVARGRHTAREQAPLREQLLSTAGREPLPVAASKKDLYGSKTIGLYGGIMLLINNLAGPTVSLMPSLTQEAGWMAAVTAEVAIAMLAAACGFMILAAMRAIPGNKDLELRVEYIDVVRFYIPGAWAVLVTLSYIGYLVMTLMACIIQTAQVIDYVFTDALGSAYGLQLWPTLQVTSGVSTGSDTPFSDDVFVFSFSFIVVAVVCAPFALKNLDDNITLQWIANIGFSVIVAVWLCFFTSTPEFPMPIPVATSSQFGLVNTLFFNFAMATSVPSWANEKLPDVSASVSFSASLGFVVIIYSAIGIVGAMAFHPYFQTDQDLFSKLNDSGSLPLQATVSLYPVLQNFTSIPVFSIMIRYNLLKLDLFEKRTATLLAVGLPWVLSIFLYTGSGFQDVSNIGGIVFSLLINNVIPVVVYLKSTWKRSIALTVQRCSSAKVSADAASPPSAEVGAGLVVAVAFAEDVTTSAYALRRGLCSRPGSLAQRAGCQRPEDRTWPARSRSPRCAGVDWHVRVTLRWSDLWCGP